MFHFVTDVRERTTHKTQLAAVNRLNTCAAKCVCAHRVVFGGCQVILLTVYLR